MGWRSSEQERLISIASLPSTIHPMRSTCLIMWIFGFPSRSITTPLLLESVKLLGMNIGGMFQPVSTIPIQITLSITPGLIFEPASGRPGNLASRDRSIGKRHIGQTHFPVRPVRIPGRMRRAIPVQETCSAMATVDCSTRLAIGNLPLDLSSKVLSPLSAGN